MIRLKITYNDLLIVSGGANGADSIAEFVASRFEIKTEIIKPDFSNGYDVRKYFERNDKIIDKCDKIIAFWDGFSRGTGYVINRCKLLDKDLEVIRY